MFSNEDIVFSNEPKGEARLSHAVRASDIPPYIPRIPSIARRE